VPPRTSAALLCRPLLAGCTRPVTYYAAHAAERPHAAERQARVSRFSDARTSRMFSRCSYEMVLIGQRG
jgi:hypothetical protein